MERLKFDTSSEKSVALSDVGTTLNHTPLRSCAKPKSTFVSILNQFVLDFIQESRANAAQLC
jgi:hypothetical protein